MERFEGRVAVVTGAASGIGRAISAALVGQGGRVVMVDMEAGALERAAADMGRPAAATTAVIDVTDPAAVDQLAEDTFAAYGAVHLLVNNAGVSVTRSTIGASLDDWRWLFDVNVWGVVHGINSFVPRMLEQGEAGHVANTCSIASWSVTPGYAIYAATKHAVAAISEGLAADLAAIDAPIGVTAVCPSAVRTQLFSAERNRPGLQGEVDLAEQQRIDALEDGVQTPEEVAAALLDGIRSGRLWVFPNRQRLDVVRARFDHVLGDGRLR